jgi:hypothetical protein
VTPYTVYSLLHLLAYRYPPYYQGIIYSDEELAGLSVKGEDDLSSCVFEIVRYASVLP